MLKSCCNNKEQRKNYACFFVHGSGTTAIAALSQNRKYIGIELNKDSVRVAEERINEYLSTQN